MNVIILGFMLPFIGTTAGAASVFFLRDKIKPGVQKALLGFAAGVMVAASVWSLLIPAIDQSASLGKLSFIPAAVGLLLGFGFLLLLDQTIPHLHLDAKNPEGSRLEGMKKTTMLMLAVTLHNIPEGMAVGVVFAGMLTGNSDITLTGAFTLAIGIAIQNFPEGAIISMPLKSSEKMGRGRAFLYGMASGAVEPLAAGITIMLTQFVTPVLPYLLAFAAGAMLYVVVEELIPETSEGAHSNIGTIGFAVGFCVMMILDVALG